MLVNLTNLFKVKYRLHSLQEIYGKNVSPNYYLVIPPQYFVDADIEFYLDGNKFFSDDSFNIFKFVLDASYWFREFFPNSEFIWNEDQFDGWSGKITITPQQSQTLFKAKFEDQDDVVEILIPTASFRYGFAEFITGFKENVESFWNTKFSELDLI